MTSLPRRAFAAAALACVLVGCGGNGADDRPTTPRGTAVAPPTSAPSTATGNAKSEAVKALPRSVPARLRIPAIGVDTAVMRVGLAADGTMEVPPVVADDRAGWYRHSPTPGQNGPSVIVGHLTVGRYGDGVFRDLSRLHRGDTVTTHLENGTTAVFTVTTVKTVPQADFPADDVYGDVDRPELRLITCGGPRSGDGYRDNVVVFAELSSSTP
ncbi:class F sortase [Streptomyces sp. NPDC014870]|uniref:class F sortase n=1 Tax=Streptomyces sp. NPDC014870 TaxID=3364925 RepID=UPI0036F850F7